MFGPKYVWFLISGRNQDNWWKVKSPLVDCTPEQVRKGLSNNIGTGELKLSPLPGTTIHGKVSVREYNSLYYRLRLIWSPLGIGFTAVVGGVGGMRGGGGWWKYSRDLPPPLSCITGCSPFPWLPLFNT